MDGLPSAGQINTKLNGLSASGQIDTWLDGLFASGQIDSRVVGICGANGMCGNLCDGDRFVRFLTES